jgi:hypothetical protein
VSTNVRAQRKNTLREANIVGSLFALKNPCYSDEWVLKNEYGRHDTQKFSQSVFGVEFSTRKIATNSLSSCSALIEGSSPLTAQSINATYQACNHRETCFLLSNFNFQGEVCFCVFHVKYEFVGVIFMQITFFTCF